MQAGGIGDPVGGLIIVPSDFSPGPGAVLTPSLTVGKLLGSGMQGTVHDLTHPDGRDTGQVLKASRSTVTSGWLIEMEWEWVVGQELRTLASGGELEGFMQTYAVLVDEKTGAMRGMVLEKLSGRSVESRIGEPGFGDVRYVRAMLRQVLRALDRAYRELGFRHRDLRVDNVMEAASSEPAHVQATAVAAAAAAVTDRQLRGIAAPAAEERHGSRTTSACARQRPNAAMSAKHAVTGAALFSERELATIRFKIIDFGHANVRAFHRKGGELHLPQLAVSDDLIRKWATKSFGARRGRPTIPQPLPIAEMSYQVFWWKRRDVYRLLLSLSASIDGVVWPDADRQLVEQLQDLIRDVTGADVADAPAKQPCCAVYRQAGGSLHGVRAARLWCAALKLELLCC